MAYTTYPWDRKCSKQVWNWHKIGGGPPRKNKRYILLDIPQIRPLSCKCVKSELDLFAPPFTQTSVEEGRWVEYGPITVVKDSQVIFKSNVTHHRYADDTQI